ncbi:MAG TPA: hypothetical protein VGQ99_20285 [Tepidisphaeraceae bacterium]|jgi:hypothetical protein|nr:hypothetical protein [Tepidisphaeraceae bacterium]
MLLSEPTEEQQKFHNTGKFEDWGDDSDDGDDEETVVEKQLPKPSNLEEERAVSHLKGLLVMNAFKITDKLLEGWGEPRVVTLLAKGGEDMKKMGFELGNRIGCAYFTMRPSERYRPEQNRPAAGSSDRDTALQRFRRNPLRDS